MTSAGFSRSDIPADRDDPRYLEAAVTLSDLYIETGNEATAAALLQTVHDSIAQVCHLIQ